MALTDNPQLKANDHNRKAAEINITSAAMSKTAAKRSTKAASQAGFFSTTTVEEICMRKGYYVNAAKVQHELSIIERDRITAGICYNVTNAYYNVVLMDMLVSAAKNSYSIALENKTLVDAQYAQGLVPKMSYDNAGISVDAAKSKLEAYELNRDIAMRNLKNLLRVDDDCTIYLTDTIKIEDFTSDVDADVISALETRYDIIGAKKSYELSKEYFDCADAFTEKSAVYNTVNRFFFNNGEDAVACVSHLFRMAEYNLIVHAVQLS
jgi:outer membrane protein TolC